MGAALELVFEGVAKDYEGVAALKDVSLTVAPGSYVVLLGPSGSGKTTLLSILGGFTAPSRGRILLGGQDITHLAPAKRPTATVFQDYALFPHLGIADNVAFGLSVRKLGKSDVAQRVDAMLKLVGLEGFGRRPIAAASGGQRQRIALARALVIEPSLLLLDEPLGALDLSLRRQMQEELRRIQRLQACTFIHVTHDQEEAMALADWVVIMNHGRIEDMGPPERVYQSPRTRFAAGFLGESTVLDGVVRGHADGLLEVQTPCGLLQVAGSRAVGEAVSIALRPEAVKLGPAAPADLALGHLRVQDTVYQGSFVRVSGEASGVQVLAKVSPHSLHALGWPQLPNLPGGTMVPIAASRSGLVLLED
jgi:spermidine/putrescine transport system ATP-binding protein